MCREVCEMLGTVGNNREVLSAGDNTRGGYDNNHALAFNQRLRHHLLLPARRRHSRLAPAILKGVRGCTWLFRKSRPPNDANNRELPRTKPPLRTTTCKTKTQKTSRQILKHLDQQAEMTDARAQPPTRSRSLTSATSARGDAAGSVHARVTLAREFATAVNAYRTTAELDMG